MYSKCRTATWLFRPAALVLAATGMDATTVWAADDDQGQTLQEIVVTATRREESLSRVPISVAAFTQQQMDVQGLKQIDDLQRFTPGLVVTRTGNSGNQTFSRTTTVATEQGRPNRDIQGERRAAVRQAMRGSGLRPSRAADRNPCVAWENTEVRRYRELLYAMRPCAALPDEWHSAWNGSASNPIRRLALHGAHLQFKHPESGMSMTFESRYPKAFDAL